MADNVNTEAMERLQRQLIICKIKDKNASSLVKVSAVTVLVFALVCEAQHYNYLGGLYGSAPVGEDGRVIETPEVARAKAAHLAAFKLASHPTYYHGASNHRSAAAPPPAYGLHSSYSNPSYFSTSVQHGPYGYSGPPAPLSHDGRVVDTPEVAQAKAAHFAAFSQAASRAHDDYGNHYPSSSYRGDSGDNEDDDGSSGSASVEAHATSQYQGPLAPLARDGRVIDTPEVAHAKAAHLAALHRASHGYFADY